MELYDKRFFIEMYDKHFFSKEVNPGNANFCW